MATCEACHCQIAADDPWYMRYGMCEACAEDVPDELRDPWQKCICPDCGSETNYYTISAMGCCQKCSHEAGDC